MIAYQSVFSIYNLLCLENLCVKKKFNIWFFCGFCVKKWKINRIFKILIKYLLYFHFLSFQVPVEEKAYKMCNKTKMFSQYWLRWLTSIICTVKITLLSWRRDVTWRKTNVTWPDKNLHDVTPPWASRDSGVTVPWHHHDRDRDRYR